MQTSLISINQICHFEGFNEVINLCPVSRWNAFACLVLRGVLVFLGGGGVPGLPAAMFFLLTDR